MIFKIIPIKDDFLEDIYEKSMKELGGFYEINWIHNTPTIQIVNDRKTINLIKKKETDDWVIGWTSGNTIYILDRDNLEKESSHKYNPEQYAATIKHELSHLFYNILSSGKYKPAWLSEGVAIYTSDQNKFKKQPVKFKDFLQFYEKGGSGVYYESGFFIKLLVEKFGRGKLLNLIKASREVSTAEEFEDLFAKEYNFNLNYKEINFLINKN